jgi:hypothetical protein
MKLKWFNFCVIKNLAQNPFSTNSLKARVGAYVSPKLNYVRRQDFEGVGNHVIVLEINPIKM